MNIKRIGQSAVSLLLLLLMLFTGVAGAEGIGMGETVKEPVTIDLTGDEEVLVEAGIFLCLGDVEGSPVSTETDTIDFNGDGTPDVSVRMNEYDNYLLKRLAGADKLTKDYTYAIEHDVYSSVTFKVYKPAPEPTTVAVTGVKLNIAKKTISVGKSFKLTATVQPSNATNQKVTWSSSNPKAAIVNQSGNITGVKPGKTYITVTTVDGKKSATCSVTVKKGKTELNAASKAFKLGQKEMKLTVTLKDKKGKAFKNTKITLKVNKKTYTTKTNSKGTATFKITNLTKKGTYQAVIRFKGTDLYNASKKTIKITVK